jgi:preprotein translocase subunit SecA
MPLSKLYPFHKLAGRPLETNLSTYRKTVEEIRRIDWTSLSDAELKKMSSDLIAGSRSGAPESRVLARNAGDPGSEKRLIRAFALICEASRRTLGLDPFDVQIIAGLAMTRGRIIELPTGEGKTLAAVFPACRHALSGRGVHILTFNDYLARRDATWMGSVYDFIGLTVGCVQEGMSPAAKRHAYACDVTYATAKEAGFDFLRDSIAYDRGDRVHRAFQTALVDEADSILIDEARIPLVISGLGEAASWDAGRLAKLVGSLERGTDYQTDAEHRNVFLTEPGAANLEAGLNCGNLFEAKNLALLEAANCALHARVLLRRDVDYIVRDGRIEIVDEFTGRVVDDRRWPDGLQAAVEAKEGIGRASNGRVLGSITLQHYFRLYPRLCGMTGTAQSGAAELMEFYGLSTVIIPPHAPCVRVDHPDEIFTHREAKMSALIREIGETHASGRPILVGTASVGESEALAAALDREGVRCRVLNARNDELEADIIAQAGMSGAVTISTNMAGRGTDIKLGGDDPRDRARIAALGGLYVIGTNRHESLRIDGQLRGRAGRQGDPGSSRFFISFDDDIFVRYGLRDMFLKRHRLGPRDAPLGDLLVPKDIIHAQRVIEGQNFDIRRSLHKYSDLVERQRRMVQDWREEVFWGGESSMADAESAGIVRRTDPRTQERGEARFRKKEASEMERRMTLFHLDRAWSDHLAWVTDTRESIHLQSLGGKSPLDEFVLSATEMFLGIRPRVEEAVRSDFSAAVNREDGAGIDPAAFRGPSSTWTYIVNEDQFGWGLELLKGRNIGAAALAAGPLGVLFMLWLIAKKLFRPKRRAIDSTQSP